MVGDEDSPLEGYTQKIEYENIPKYCTHCRKLGHNVTNCRVLEKKQLEDKKNIETTTKGRNDTSIASNKRDPSSMQGNIQTNINRGRERHQANNLAGYSRRGKSAPPKSIFKPTGAIFGVDKPLPTSEKISTKVDEILLVKISWKWS